MAKPVTNADVGTTKRKAMSPTRRLRIYEAHNGICVTCQQKINPGEKWFIEHVIALELGGPDADDNCRPAHYACKAVKDADDHKRAAKAKRAKKASLGIKADGPKLQSRGFPATEKPQKTLTKALPPRRSFYKVNEASK